MAELLKSDLNTQSAVIETCGDAWPAAPHSFRRPCAPPLRVASLNAADLTAELSATAQGQQLVALAGTPTCGVDFHYFRYQTVGGKGWDGFALVLVGE